MHPTPYSNKNVNHIEKQVESEVLIRLKRGDEQAWAYFVDKYANRLYGYLQHRLPDSEIVENVLTETLLAAVGSIRNFDGNVTLTTFIFALANRKIADYWRKHPTIDTVQDQSSGVTDSRDSVEPSSDKADLQLALSRLTDSHLQVLLMRYHIGLTVDEIAAILDTSYKATESLLSRARMELRKILDKPIQDEIKKNYDLLLAKILGISLDRGARLSIKNRKIVHEQLQEVLIKLDDQEKQILELRFGMRSGVPLTQREVGIQLGLSTSRVGQVERQAIQKLRTFTIVQEFTTLLGSDNDTMLSKGSFHAPILPSPT